MREMSVLDVAQFILDQRGGHLSRMTLQKLTFYSQAWNLVWNKGNELFDEDFEAWIDGPVCRDLYDAHTSYEVSQLPNAHPEKLSESERRIILAVLNYYGNFNGNQLSELTHTETPWLDARAGLLSTQRSRKPITKDAMRKYYSEKLKQNSKSLELEATPA